MEENTPRIRYRIEFGRHNYIIDTGFGIVRRITEYFQKHNVTPSFDKRRLGNRELYFEVPLLTELDTYVKELRDEVTNVLRKKGINLTRFEKA